MTTARSAVHSSVRFGGQGVLITGAGGGIGRETALRFAAEGAKVAVVDIDRDAAESVVATIAESGGESVALTCDVTSAAAVEALVAQAVEALGDLSVVVNNAGGGAAAFVEMDEAEWDRQINLNLKSAFLVSHAVWPVLKARGGGTILNAGSIAGRWGQSGLLAYSTSKAAIAMFTRALALDGGPFGIRVNCVVPGNIRTPALEAFFESQDDPASVYEKAVAMTSVGRLGTSADVAEAYLYLASDAASFITGTELLIDGGLTLGLRE